MRMTISAAARLYGIHRATLHRHIKAGRLSCVFDPDGSRALDLSELIRCYGEPSNAPEAVRQVATGSATLPAIGDATPPVADGQALPADLLTEMLEVMREQREELAALRREVAELRRLPAPGQLAPHDDHRGREKAQERSEADTPADAYSPRLARSDGSPATT